MQSDIRVTEVTPYYIDAPARTPLKFGAVVVPSCTYCQVKVRVSNRDGAQADGWGGMFLMDFWAWPDFSIEHADRDRAMRALTDNYAKRFVGRDFAHPIDLFLEVEKELPTGAKEVATALEMDVEIPLLASFVAASPIDAAVHDAFGNVNGVSSYDACGKDHMTHDLAHYLGASYAGRYVGDCLKRKFDERVPIFHLVGGLDKLRRSEVDDSDPADGMPNCLEEWVERDGLVCLKVKLRGSDVDWDVERILEVVGIAHEVQDKRGVAELCFSADTNEQCESPDYIVEMLTKLRERDERAYAELLYVEQPTERDLAAHRWDMRPIARMKPVIIDESLTGLPEYDLAMELGWSGVALKTCKCHSSALLVAAKTEADGVPYTIQDLTNPALALIHSTGLAARLNPMKGFEGNSCQFFPAASEPEAKVHPKIFTRIDGHVSTESIVGTGLGYQIDRIDRSLD